MSAALNRRQVVRAALGVAALAAPMGAAWAQMARAVDAPLRATSLASDLIWISGAGGNVAVAAGADGLLMVDGGLASRSAELLDFVKRETGESRVATLINTHWHPEQTGSNVALGKAGAQIVAHENTRLWLSHEFWLRWQDRTFQPLPETGQPNRSFRKTLALEHDGRPVECGYMMQAHTDGDIYVRFPDRNVILSGGVGSTDGWPVLDWGTGGWIIGLMDGLDTLTGLSDAETKILPASGPLVTPAELAEQRAMYEAIQKEVLRLIREGQSLDEIVLAGAASEYAAQWGDPAQFLALAYQGMVLQMRGQRMRIA